MDLWADYHCQQREDVIVIKDSERKAIQCHNTNIIERTVGWYYPPELSLPESIVFVVEVVHLSRAEDITDSL